MLDLETIKWHLKIEPDVDDENHLLEIWSGAAKNHVEHYTDRKLYATPQQSGYAEDPTALLLDDEITAAMLLLIGHWYASREAVAIGTITSELPMGVVMLLWPHRRLGV